MQETKTNSYDILLWVCVFCVCCDRRSFCVFVVFRVFWVLPWIDGVVALWWWNFGGEKRTHVIVVDTNNLQMHKG